MMNTIFIDNLTFIRAGRDYLGVAWSANVVGEDCKNFHVGEPIQIRRKNGSPYIVYPVKTEKIDDQITWLITDFQGAMMFDF